MLPFGPLLRERERKEDKKEELKEMTLVNNVQCLPPAMTPCVFLDEFWMYSPNWLFLSYVVYSPPPPFICIFLILFSFCIVSLSWNFNVYLISVQHTVKETKTCLVGLWLLGAHSQTSKTKLINMTHLANNSLMSLMLKCAREIWNKMCNCIVLCASGYKCSCPHSQTAKRPRFKSISLSLWRTTESLMCQQKGDLGTYPTKHIIRARLVDLTNGWSYVIRKRNFYIYYLFPLSFL